jgi:putative heme-binding domain-containing protein
LAGDTTAKPQARLQAMEALRAAAHPPLAEVAFKVVESADSPAELRLAAIRALASTADASVPGRLLAGYAMLDAQARREVVATLAARPAWAVELLGAVEKNQLKTTEVPAETVRQLHTVGDDKLKERITKAWGAIRATPADRLRKIEQVRKAASAPGPVDLAHGRHLYQKVCAQCHTLYGVGGKVGPELTGSNRASLDYLLENILDPSAVIPKEYAATVVELKNGRFLTGMIRDENDNTLTVVGANETLTLSKADIEDRKASDMSMMPDNLVANLDNRQIRDLLAYLRHPSQTPILATAETSKAFFNGKDLAGWNGDEKLWSVQQGEHGGEIVGKSPGIKRNSFLKSDMEVRDFRLKLQVKLTPDGENSGIQFRSEPLPDGEMRGPQADAGKGWWGKLYEESGRGLLWKDSGEQHVKPGEWNDYVIEAVGPRVRTWINGQPCVDLTDEKISRKGVVGLQVHSGGPLEVRFRKIELEVLEAPAK